MGHKVHPTIHRTQVIYTWDSKWFGKRSYAEFAEQDIAIRNYIDKKHKDAHIDSISVERGPKNVTVTVFAAKPGFIIGRGGQGLDVIRQHIEKKILKMKQRVKLNIQEVTSPALSARVVAMTVAEDIERRVAFRRSMKQTIERVMVAGAKGVKVSLSGRLNGVDIARHETLSEGKVPLITLRSDVDYANVKAHTTYGVIGVKVWIYKGEVFGRKDKFSEEEKSIVQANAPKRRTPSRKANNRNK
jgi:small subunit ribosomal protein S3